MQTGDHGGPKDRLCAFYKKHHEGVHATLLFSVFMIFCHLNQIGQDAEFYLSDIGRIIFCAVILCGPFVTMWSKFYKQDDWTPSIIVGILVTLVSSACFIFGLNILYGFVVVMTSS